jgi:hypothetical protein
MSAGLVQVSTTKRRSEQRLENGIESSRVNIYHAEYVHDQSISEDALYLLLLSCHCYYHSINNQVSVLSKRFHIIYHHSTRLLIKGAHIFVTICSTKMQNY